MDFTSDDHGRESRLIVGCCQTVIPPDTIDSLSEILAGEVDWDHTIAVARRNAVLPLVAWNLITHFEDRIPDGVKQSLERELQAHRQNNLFQTGKLIELVRLFRENGIEALPFKGPMLAIQAYGDPVLRKYGDLDILVQPKQFDKAVKLLQSNGYTPVTSVGWLNKRDWYISRKKDIYFVNENGSVRLELHWKLSGSHFGLPKEMNLLWERLEYVDLAGTQIPALSFNDLLIYLCLHGSRHGWERLAWICDVNELIRSNNSIDWLAVADFARRAGCENVVALGLRLIRDLLGFQMPPGSDLNGLVDEQVFDDIVNDIRLQLFSQTTQHTEMGDRYAYHLKLKERPSDRLKLHYHYLSWYLRLLVTPTEMDRSVVHLPDYLSPLHYVTRPFRLLLSYISSRTDKTLKIKMHGLPHSSD